MSKSKREILAKPHVFKKDMDKQFNHVIKRIEHKVKLQNANDPYGMREAMRQRMLYGKIGYIEQTEANNAL